jgi:membrane protease YdiL (CAAX protease family)
MDSETPGFIVCGRCGESLRAGARFCARCGARAWPEAQEQLESPVQLAVTAPRPSTDRWGELRVVGWLYGLLLLSSLIFGIAYSANPAGDFQPWITLIDAIVILGFAGYYRAEIITLLRPSTFDRNALRKLGIATAIQFIVLGAVFYLLEKTGIPFERITDEIQLHDYAVWQLLALNSLAPAVVEEIAFRGIIFGRLRRVLGEREGWQVQAAFFAILHLSPVIFPTHFAMGLIFGWLRMRTGSLLPGMILHALWNAASILLELYQ